MKRVLEIEKFRNIGVEEKQTLVLNNSMKKGEMGNLVIVVGENNSGKSNVLDAFTTFASGKFAERDFTELNYEEEYQNPKLSLIIEGGGVEYKYKITGNGGIYSDYPENKGGNYNINQIIDQCLKLISAILQQCAKFGFYDWAKKARDLHNVFSNSPSLDRVEKNYIKLYNLTKEIFEFKTSIFKPIKKNIINICYADPIVDKLTEETTISEAELINEVFKRKYGIMFFPKVYSYKEKPITTSMLNISYTQVANSPFFPGLLKALGLPAVKVIDTYEKFSESKNKGVLLKLETELNDRLKNVTKKFNDLFFKTDSYKFRIDLESDRLYFAIFKEGYTVNLDRQSTGFKWYFNLFFNLLCDGRLTAGDIIILDEPALNLHIQGQMELRKELKRFAVQNDITIIIATHSPFLIDLDYLDELRFVSTEGSEAKIHNDFSMADSGCDTLNPIKKALTVNNNVLYSPDAKVVFVEGITDYNYMVAFKNKFELTDLIFLPINGVGTNKTAQREISEQLIKIRKHDPILMVDSDGAGKSMKEVNKDSALTVVTLSEADEKFKEIESLFSEDDAKKYGIINEKGEDEKHSAQSSVFKTYQITETSPSKKTESNFKKLFDYINTL